MLVAVGWYYLVVDWYALVMHAVTRLLAHDLDLNGVARGDGVLFVRDGVGLVGRGVVVWVVVDDVVDALVVIDYDDAFGGGVLGVGLVVIGCLVFLFGVVGELVIFWVVVGKGFGGECWVMMVDGDDFLLVDVDVELVVLFVSWLRVDCFTIRFGVVVVIYLVAVVAV